MTCWTVQTAAGSHAACVLVIQAPLTCVGKTWVTTLLLAWLSLPLTQQLLEYLPRGLPRCRQPQDPSGGVLVTMGKCFCFPTSGSVNPTNEQNFEVRLIVSSGEPPSRTRQMFFLPIRGSLEDVSEPGAWRNKTPGWVCGWGRALLWTSGPCLLPLYGGWRWLRPCIPGSGLKGWMLLD